MTQYTLQILAAVFGTGGLTFLFMYHANKSKLKAETNHLIGQTYGDLIDDMRETMKYQGEQIKSLQDREIEYLKIINAHRETEKELRTQIKALETKLSTYIKKHQ